MFNTLITHLNDALYGYILILILIAGGLYFTVRTGFVQFRLFGAQINAVTERNQSGVSSFQALMVSTASRVGTGNIIGVSTALCLGGFGSVFWMWIIALIGGATAFIESTLAQIYKKRGAESSYGGPAYYIEAAFKRRWPAILFSVFLILTYGFGFNMLASYNLQSTFAAYSFYDPKFTPWLIGLILAAISCYCLLGGGKRILKVTGVLVPVMGVAYVLIALIVILLNLPRLPEVFARIFSEAFDLQAIFGGFSGSCVMYGIKRGLFSNEAGVGSAPNASATAEVSHPVKQGLVQILSVFIDTILICSATAFLCMSSGVEPTEALSGAPYVQAAVSTSLGSFGPIFITVAMVLFAFTTLLGNIYYVDQCICYILGRVPGKLFHRICYIIASLIILLGAGLNAGLLWNIADVLMGLMTLINMPVILYLSRYALSALKDFDRQRKAGKDPRFRAKDIDLPHPTDYWK
ncbi:MAG: alanine:cation symporter family protein [Clostridia bacterium]|nr:alanine:cation symporter family protein [Clostridia bacterium]